MRKSLYAWEDLVEALSLYIGLVLWGLAIGLVAGLAGVGGGALVTPLFKLAYGLPIISATSTSLFTILPTSLSGAVRHVKNGYTNLKVGLVIGLTGAAFSIAGSLAAPHVPDVVLTVLTAACMVIPVATIIWSLARQRKTSAVEEIPVRTWENTHLNRAQAAVCALTGVLCGMLGGMVGIGGGAGLLTPVLLGYLRMGMHEMAGTSSVIICLSSIPAIVVHAALGDINWLFGILIVCGTVPGAQLGARITPKVSSFALKIFFCCVMVVCSVAMVLNALA